MSWPWAPPTQPPLPPAPPQPNGFLPQPSPLFHQQLAVTQNVNQHMVPYHGAQSSYFPGYSQANYLQQYQYPQQVPTVYPAPVHSAENRSYPGANRGRARRPHSQRNELGLGEKGNSRMPRQVEKELAHARDVLASLGRTMPGDSAEEIARYVAERKRNWPRATRKVMNEKKCKTGNALTEVAESYGGGQSDEEESNNLSITESPKLSATRLSGSGASYSQKRRNNLSSGIARRQRVGSRRSNLLAQLLKKEVERERKTLLQAFEYLLDATASLNS